jgi:hypothetical protein
MKFKNMYAVVKSKLTGTPTFLVNPQAPIKEAFISNGVIYYQFEDIFSMPCHRALEATTFYEEMKSKISKEYLDEYIEGMSNILSNPSGINVTNIVLLTNTLKERSEFIIDSDIVFKLASVMYFDKHENPYKYDMLYNRKKIRDWKDNNDTADFFLSTPIKSLLPFTDISEDALRSYLKIQEEVKNHQKKTISELIYKTQKTAG